MGSYSAHVTKAVLAGRTILDTSFSSWRMAHSACHNAANQKWSELSRLLHLLRPLRPLWLMEIGVHSGGTLTLWARVAHPAANLIGIDVRISSKAEECTQAKIKNSQTVHLIEADSHSDSGMEKVRACLGANKLDFLFIDGDHEYHGVKRDWEMYSSFVRTGGIVAFHDIVPDHGSRFGIKTNHDAGGVHQLWDEIKHRFPHKEFIESRAQNGYGIGVLTF